MAQRLLRAVCVHHKRNIAAATQGNALPCKGRASMARQRSGKAALRRAWHGNGKSFKFPGGRLHEQTTEGVKRAKNTWKK